jgi:hypothetical protein
MPESFGAFVAEALEGVKRDAPACAASMARSIGTTRVDVHVDGETIAIWCEGAEIELARREPPYLRTLAATASLTTTSRALLDLLDGRRSLLSAVASNEVRVRARPVDAAGLFDALSRFVEGVARCNGAASSIERFRRHVLDGELLGGDR